jgi:hypothetical protein
VRKNFLRRGSTLTRGAIQIYIVENVILFYAKDDMKIKGDTRPLLVNFVEPVVTSGTIIFSRKAPIVRTDMPIPVRFVGSIN